VLKIVVHAFLLGIGVLVVANGTTSATTLIYASPYGPNHPFSTADRAWIKWVEERSRGTLKIRPIWSGSLLTADQSLIELRHGVADIGLITPIYVRGGAQLLRAQTGFYAGARTFAQQVAMYRCLEASFPEFSDELKGLVVLAVQGGTLPGILTRTRPVVTLGDLRGLRIRAPSEVIGVLKDLGADPVTMPMAEVYSAMAKGVVDGVVAPTDVMKSMHFAEVAKFYSQLQIGRGAYPARAISARRWHSLAPVEREILTASSPIWEAALAQQTQAAAAAGDAYGREAGIQFSPISETDQRRFDALDLRDAERDARELNQYGIDGLSVFHYARQVADAIAVTGQVNCPQRQRQ
jgi:TRAP-type C4-dicarboxylate transport system substrate-binding protein